MKLKAEYWNVFNLALIKAMKMNTGVGDPATKIRVSMNKGSNIERWPKFNDNAGWWYDLCTNLWPTDQLNHNQRLVQRWIEFGLFPLERMKMKSDHYIRNWMFVPFEQGRVNRELRE